VRIGDIDARTRIAGVTGSPIVHSLSPIIHNTWIQAAGLNAAYVAFPVEDARFEEFLGVVRSGAISGLNVTLPFKQRVLQATGSSSALARKAGAANLVWRDSSGELSADNTDGAGLLYALERQANYHPGPSPIVILGAGGAARGAVATFLDKGAQDIRIVNRTLARAEALKMDQGVAVFEWSQIEEALEGAACIVNTTSAGLIGEGLPNIPFEVMQAEAVAMDMTYKPLITEFLRLAKTSGLRTVDGLEMLIGQARPSFETLFDHPVPDIDIREVVLKTLGEISR